MGYSIVERINALSIVKRRGKCGAWDMEDVFQEKALADFLEKKRCIRWIELDHYRKFNRFGFGRKNKSFAETAYHYVEPPQQRREPSAVKTLINRELVTKALNCLNGRTKKIIKCLYFEGILQAEVGRMFGVSYSRISQVKKEALERMRKYLGKELVI